MRSVGPRPPGRSDRILGLDEAGRGSVLGPLVIGGFLCDAESLARLRDVGVRDSKLLAPRRRQEVRAQLDTLGECRTVVLPPSRIDPAVRRGRLNRLEAAAFARLVRTTRPSAVGLDACEVDTVRFGREVAELAGFAGPIDARNHADRDLPVVGAASIVAKVRRDELIADLARRLGCAIGSGYPSDPTTRRYLEATLRPGEGPPSWVRASWRTTATVMAERSRTTLDRYAP